jgi:hypothetical protein
VVAFVRKGKRPGIQSLLKAAPKSRGFPPRPIGAEYQYGTHESAIKGSYAAGYAVTFGAFLALASNAMLQHKGTFVQTIPQEPQYQASYVNPACRGLFVVAAQSPVIKSVLGQQQNSAESNQSAVYVTTTRLQRPLFASIGTLPQEQQQLAPSAVYTTTQRLQRPLWSAVITAPQASQEIAPSAVYTVTAAKGLQTPLMVPIVQSWPQESQQQAPSAVYQFPPASQQAASPALRNALLTQAEQPDTTQSSVKTTNIALALAAPSLRGAIVTQAEQPLPAPSLFIPATGALPIQSPVIRAAISTMAEQPLPAPSWVQVTTAYTPSFVAGVPPLRTWAQTVPQEQAPYEVNASFVQVPTAANLPSVTPTPPVVSAQTPAGRHKHRRYFIEIDHQTFQVDSPAEALELLEKMKQVAVKPSKAAAAMAVRRAIKSGKVPQSLRVPQIKSDSPELQDIVISGRKALESLYATALQEAEIKLLLAKQKQLEDDDDDDILLLM